VIEVSQDLLAFLNKMYYPKLALTGTQQHEITSCITCFSGTGTKLFLQMQCFKTGNYSFAS